MSELLDMVARAVSPTMTREEREAVYAAVKAAVLRHAEGAAPDDPGLIYQQHVVEETIRDVEAEITRYLALRQLEEASREGGPVAAGGGTGRA